jgi:hypothetical protein
MGSNGLFVLNDKLRRAYQAQAETIWTTFNMVCCLFFGILPRKARKAWKYSHISLCPLESRFDFSDSDER